MGLELTGFVRRILPAQQISERFTKRELVVETMENPRYPQTVQFEASGDRCALFDHLREGDEVRIEFSVRGREWRKPGTTESKYFNTLSVFAVTKIGAAAERGSGRGGSQQELGGNAGGQEDDIPFASCDVAREPSPIARVLR